MTFEEKLAQYRATKGLSAKAMADILFISRPTYQELEKGKKVKIAPDALKNLEAKTGIDIYSWTTETAPLPLVTAPVSSGLRSGRKPVIRTTEHEYTQRQIASRIKQIIQNNFDGNQRAFAETVKINETVLSRMLDNKRDISRAKILQICQYTGISADWLQTGEDRPDAPEKAEESRTGTDEQHQGKQLDEFLAKNGVSWAELSVHLGHKSLSATTNLRNSKQFRGDVRNRIIIALARLGYSEKDIFGVPVRPAYPENPETSPESFAKIVYIPVHVREGFRYDNYLKNTVEYINVPKNLITPRDSDKHVVIDIFKDGMEPLLRPGSQVLALEIDTAEWNTQRGPVAVELENEFVVKRILHNTLTQDEKSTVELTSDNPLFGKITVSRSQIRHVWKLLSVIYAPIE